MKRVLTLACAMMLAGGMAASVLGQEVQLDISSGFNWDIWCGAKEFQALKLHAATYWALDLVEMQGGDATHNGPSYLVGNNLYLISEIDAAIAEAMGCVQDAGGVYCAYAGPTDWYRPNYKSDTQATPADGVLTGADRTYHIAGHVGNDTLPGDWTEVADTTTWDMGGYASGTGLGVNYNVMANFTRSNTATIQDVEVVAELPEEQKGSYNNVNFVVAVMDGSYGGRHKRIWALYGDGGTDRQLLYAWDDAAADLRPQMDGSGAPYDDFSPVNTTAEYYNVASGATGGIAIGNRTMYEFSEPFPLDKTKTLWGFMIDDSMPDVQYQARGAAIWAATAFAAGIKDRPDSVASTVVVDPDKTPSDESQPAVVTVTVKDGSQNLLSGLSDAIDFLVSGDGTSTITFVEEPSEGVYVFEFTNDTAGTKYLEVSIDDDPPSDPIVISGLGTVIVFDPEDIPVADAGPDQVLEDLDESGDQDVVLDGSASTDANGTIVSYVWSWLGTEIAVGETAVVTLPLGARQIDLTVTDNDGFTDTDSLWVQVRAKGYDSNLVQLDISSGFNVDALWGSYEFKALFWYAWDNDPDLDGVEAQGSTAQNPDIGWLVFSLYGDGYAMAVNNTRDTYTTYHQWWNPAYIDGVEGLPESGYLAGANGVDYYMASTSGNPVLPTNVVEAGDDLTLAAQLGPYGYVSGAGMDISMNTMVAGCSHTTSTWQKIETTAWLPVEQLGAYPNLNCVVTAFDYARDYRGRYMRLAAVYDDQSEEIIWAWDDEADTTPCPTELAIDNPDYNLLVQTTDYYRSNSSTTGLMNVGSYALYEFAAPLALNGEKVLKGLKLYDSNPTVNGEPRGIAIFAATAGTMDAAGPPEVEVATEDDLDWVYENVTVSHSNGSHKVGVTVTVLDLNGNNAVTVTLQKKVGSGPGEVTFRDGATDLEKYIVGPDRDKVTPLAGSLVVEVVCQGDKAPLPTIVEVPFQVNLLGDINADGGVQPGDTSLMIKKLNANPGDPAGFSGYHLKAFDLNGDTGIEPSDLSVLLNILNGYL